MSESFWYNRFSINYRITILVLQNIISYHITIFQSNHSEKWSFFETAAAKNEYKHVYGLGVRNLFGYYAFIVGYPDRPTSCTNSIVHHFLPIGQ